VLNIVIYFGVQIYVVLSTQVNVHVNAVGYGRQEEKNVKEKENDDIKPQVKPLFIIPPARLVNAIIRSSF